jgi:hypothetical protein
MPVKPTGSENEQEFIGRCMSEEKDSFPDEVQRYAVCKSKWDAENMSEELAIEDTSELPEPKEGEAQSDYIMRCIPTIYKPGGDYDQRTATAMCADRYQNSNTLLSKSPFQKKIEEFERNYNNWIKLAEGGLENACWDGYEAIGTKILNGKEVPNCVPIKK